MALRTRYARTARVFSTVFVLFCAALCWSNAAWAAHTSFICPAQTATVGNGGTVAIDVTACANPIALAGDGPVDGPQLPSHGTANLRITGGSWFVDYGHNSDAATSDVFEFSDTDGDIVRVAVTITPANSTVVVAPAALTLTAGTAVSQALSASGGTAPYTFTLQAGTPPPGITVNAGVISGTPTQRGAYTFTVRATDATSATADKTYSGTVQNPSLSLVPAAGTAIQGVAFTQTLTTTGGVAPYLYAMEASTLPTGLSLNAGVISGTATAAPGTYPVTIRVTDSSTGTGTYFEVENFTMTVSAAPSVSIAVAPASVSEDGGTNLVYTVTRSLNLSSPTVVNLTTSGTATSGVDYTGGVATVTIPSGATTATVTVGPTADATVEANETVILTVAAGSGYTVGAPASATGTILNDDVPTASITVSPATANEDSGTPLVYTVTLDQPSLVSLSIAYTVGGTATSGTDYAAVSSPLSIAAGATAGTITVTPTADSAVEANETVVLTLAAGTGYGVGAPTSATGTILDDDQPALSISDVSLNEGDSGTTAFTFTVSLDAPAGPGGVSFDIATANGTATAGSDYVAQALTGQSIAAGSSSATFIVQVNGDTFNEPNETFFVNVSNVTGATVADAQGLGTIINDDVLPSLSINDTSVTEGNAGTVTATLTVTLSAASGQTVTVNYATANASAVAPTDYISASGTLTFAPGTTTQTIAVNVNGDTTPEADETFAVNLTAPTNATLADAQGIVTVLNDDQPVTVAPAALPPPAIAVAYSQTIVASGGSGSYSYAATSGSLPPGLTLSAGGVLAGTPTAGGSYAFSVTATDTSTAPGPYTGTQAYVLTVGAPTLVLPGGPLPGATLAQPYTATVGPASGGTAPYAYTITAGSVPQGLSMAASGVFSGTPTALGTFNFTVTATDSSTGVGAPYSTSTPMSITVADGLPVAGNISASVAYGAPAAPVMLELSGGAASSVAIGTAPLHGTATVAGPTSISYQPAAGFAGSDSFTYTASNGTGTSAPATVTVTVGTPTITVSANGLFSAVAGAPYSQTFSWSGGAAPYTGHQVTNLPAGLSITASTADSVTISGTPTQAGSFNLVASATDSSTGTGPFTTGQGFTLSVASPTLVVTPATLPSATAGTAYQQAVTSSGGVAPYSNVLTGALPSGVAFDAGTGVLSGIPTQSGSFALTVTVTDSTTGTPASVVQNYTLQVVTPALTLAPAAGTLTPTTAGSVYQVAFAAGGGVAPYTFAITTGTLPAGLALDAA
ncbi:MAG: putative Ig domain-containing protein, partial [Stenotrophomonas maltophilia]